MTARFNHTSIAARAHHESADLHRQILERTTRPSGALSSTSNGTAACYCSSPKRPDRAMDRVHDRSLEYRADPQRQRSGETNTEHGGLGLGVYVLDPAGHYIELITQPYL